MRLIVAFVCVCFAFTAWAGDELAKLLFEGGAFQVKTEETETSVKQETKRRLFLPGGGVRPTLPRSLVRPTIGVRTGVFLPTSAEVSRPDAAVSLGLFFRFPLHPLYNVGRFELAFDIAAMHMSMDRYQNGSLYDDIWEDYNEVTITYLATIPTAMRWAPNFYLGFGFGYASESRTYKRSGSIVDEMDSDSAIFIARFGWDSYRNFAFEISFRVLTDYQRNITTMAQVSFCLYIP